MDKYQINIHYSPTPVGLELCWRVSIKSVRSRITRKHPNIFTHTNLDIIEGQYQECAVEVIIQKHPNIFTHTDSDISEGQYQEYVVEVNLLVVKLAIHENITQTRRIWRKSSIWI